MTLSNVAQVMATMRCKGEMTKKELFRNAD